jgi:Erythromycin esterase
MGIGGGGAARAIRPGDDLQKVSAGVFEVGPTAAVPRVDRARFGLLGVGPVRQFALADTTKDCIAVRPDPDLRFPSAGSYLRRWYGEHYRSIGFTFDHGTVTLGPGQTATMPPPAPGWFEQPLGDVPHDQFILDLRQHAPRPVQRWRHGPLMTHGLADAGPDSSMAGGSLAQWFDVIIHRQTVTGAEPT